jgi:hypothetical protein
MLVGVCAGRFADGIRWAGRRTGGSTERGLAILASAGLPVLVVISVALVLPTSTSYARDFLSGAYDPEPTIAPQIPKGSCVVFDEAGNLIDSNRFLPSGAGCPALVDAFGLWLTDNDGHAPPTNRRSTAFVAKWRSWLERADYAVLTVPQSDYLPWTPELISWFNSNYRLAASQSMVYVYEHVR